MFAVRDRETAQGETCSSRPQFFESAKCGASYRTKKEGAKGESFRKGNNYGSGTKMAKYLYWSRGGTLGKYKKGEGGEKSSKRE